MVMCLDSSNTYRSKRLVYLRSGSANPIFTCRIIPQARQRNPLNGKLDNRLSQTNRKRHEPPKHCSLLPDLSTPARGTFKSCWILTNPKDRPSLFKTSMNIMDSTPRDPKTVIEYPRGHAFLAFADSFKKPRRQNACPFSLFNKVHTYAKSPKGASMNLFTKESMVPKK